MFQYEGNFFFTPTGAEDQGVVIGYFFARLLGAKHIFTLL